MTPRKARQRQSQNNISFQANQPSDYESDLNNRTELPPPPSSRTNDQLNLSVLRRHDPSIAQVISVAPYAVIYVFTSTSQQWEKSGIEGTLFVCQLFPNESGTERFAVFTLNRRGLDNFRVELSASSSVEVTTEYVILQANDDNGDPQVYGLWIFSEPPPSSTANIRAINAQIIQECATRVEMSRTYHMENQLHKAAEIIEAEQLGQQASWKEISSQKEERGDSWGDKSYTSPPSSNQFLPSADTNFFRSSKKNAQNQETPTPVSPVQPNNHGANLLELLKHAGEIYQNGN